MFHGKCLKLGLGISTLPHRTGWESVVQLDASKEYLLCQVNKEKLFLKKKNQTKQKTT